MTRKAATKRCPFCAERIQKAAIVCRYCGRDLPAGPPKEAKRPKPGGEKPQHQRSAWRAAAIGAGIVAALTLLYYALAFFALPTTSPLQFRAAWQDWGFHLITGVPLNFLISWALFAFLIWLWRKIGAGYFLAGAVVIGMIGGSVLLVNATATPPPIPTRTPDPCLWWDEVTPSMEGKTVCVQGIVVDIDVGSGSPYEYPWPSAVTPAAKTTPTLKSARPLGPFLVMIVVFSDKPNTFFLKTWLPDLKIGDCVAAIGAVRLNAYGTPFMDSRRVSSCE